jgi:general secretion pathway protein G
MNVTRNRRRCRRHAFSLMEIMIVIVIIGMIAGLVGPALIKNLDKAKVETAEAQVKLLENACKDFYLDMSEYPKDLNDLVTNSGNAKWDGPYLEGTPPKLPVDPWGSPYQYDPSTHAVSSMGKDKASGSADDIPSRN